MMETKSKSKQMNRRDFLQAAALGGGAAMLTACAPAAVQAPATTQAPTNTPAPATPTAVAAKAEAIKISWWNQFSTDTCKKWFPEIVNTFMTENPGIQVEFEISGGPPGGGNYTELLLARIAAGNPPDTITLWDPPSSYGSRGALAGIDDLMANAATAKSSAFYPGVLRSCQFKGKTYGLPASAGVGCLFINKKLFEDKGLSTKREDMPKTWSDLRELSAKLTSYKGSDLDIYGMAPWDTNTMLSTWSQLNGGTTFDPGTLTYKIDTPQNVEWFKFWLDWLEKQYNGNLEKLNIVATVPDVYPNSAFALGKSAIATSGAWATTDAGIPFKWELFTLPVGPSGSAPKTFYWPNWFAMPKGGAHPNESFKFVEHMTTKGWAVWYENATLDTPAWTGVSADVVNKALEKQEGRDRAIELQKYFSEMLKTTADVWTSPIESFATDTLASAVGELMNKKTAPAAALANAQKVIQAKLDETMKNG
jgi:ABC-type glycerol-3-phosphate transport system substrate-binding protein